MYQTSLYEQHVQFSWVSRLHVQIKYILMYVMRRGAAAAAGRPLQRRGRALEEYNDLLCIT